MAERHTVFVRGTEHEALDATRAALISRTKARPGAERSVLTPMRAVIEVMKD